MSQWEKEKAPQSCEDIALVLLGTNTENKCMIGNTILQEELFNTGEEMYARFTKTVGDHQLVCIINTPDLLHQPVPEPEAIRKEQLNPSYPGPRVFLLVLQDNKLSQEEMEMFNQLKVRFEEKMVENTIVVMVSGEEESPGDIYYRADKKLKEVLDECGKRICVHNKNQDKKEAELIKQILDIWDRKQKPVHESSNFAPGGEHLYEEVDDIGLMKPPSKVENDQPSAGDYITVVLLGENNADKCLIGNTILENEQFQSENVTYETYTGQVAGQSVHIIKAPDPFYSNTTADSMEGSRVFLFVLQGEELSQEEMKMFTQLKERFGKQIMENTILLVKSEKKLSSHSMDKSRVNFKNDPYKQLLDECGNRVCYYNKDITNSELVNELMEFTKEIMKRNQAFKSDTERTCETPAKMSVEPMPTPNKMVNQEHQSAAMSVRDANFITIVLLGQTGSGKSATGNTILGKQRFVSRASSVPVTQVCQKEEETVHGMKIRVIDTPDFFNEDIKNQAEQLKLCKELIQHRPVVYLLVMQLGRFTDGEREVLPHLKKEFGEDVTTNTVILFTGKEKLQNKTLDDYIRDTDQELQQLIQTCNFRCHAFKNQKKSSQQVKKLLQIISKMQTDRNISMEKSDHYNIRQNNSNKLMESKNCRIL